MFDLWVWTMARYLEDISKLDITSRTFDITRLSEKHLHGTSVDNWFQVGWR